MPQRLLAQEALIHYLRGIVNFILVALDVFGFVVSDNNSGVAASVVRFHPRPRIKSLVAPILLHVSRLDKVLNNLRPIQHSAPLIYRGPEVVALLQHLLLHLLLHSSDFLLRFSVLGKQLVFDFLPAASGASS